MPKFLVSLYHPTDYDPTLMEDSAMDRAIDALNDEMIAAGVRHFVGGLYPVDRAHSLRAQADGSVALSHGPYLNHREHIGGLWVLDTATLDEALDWGRKAAIACRAPVEVRPFH